MPTYDTARVQEGFPQQRLVVVPSNVIKRCQILPMVRHLYVTDIGTYPNAPHHYVARPLGSPSVILIYCLRGKGSLQLKNTLHTIQPGHLIIIPPNTPHTYQADETDPWSIFWIHFTGEQAQSLLDSITEPAHHPLLFVPDTRLMRNAFEEVYACLNYHHSDAGLLAMTSELLRLFSAAKLHQGFHDSQRQSVEDRVASTLVFMEQHLNMPLTLKDLAAHAGQSIPYYTMLFQKRTNQSPIACFIQLKICKACELLDQTDSTIREIAAELGYDDPYYFSRIFKKVQGCSPAIYRQSTKG